MKEKMIKKLKTLESKRLLFRSFNLADSQLIYQFLQEKEIADNTISIPYPYLEGMAEAWIGTHQQQLAIGDYKYAVVLKDTSEFIGAIEIFVVEEFHHGILGYWLAKPFWGKGYGTEAVARIIQFGFEDLKLHKIIGEHFKYNHRSGRVMEKNGMQQEGRMREHKIKWGNFVDVDVKAILRSEWEN